MSVYHSSNKAFPLFRGVTQTTADVPTTSRRPANSGPVAPLLPSWPVPVDLNSAERRLLRAIAAGRNAADELHASERTVKMDDRRTAAQAAGFHAGGGVRRRRAGLACSRMTLRPRRRFSTRSRFC
ncbi:hypothetical protein [Micromonospora sp. NPDC047527]|uniref:hypothetical protein n=1 Tax=Micromonospora sp. NPDC047527 TaxID=3155144 RepID=UPI0033E6BA5D